MSKPSAGAGVCMVRDDLEGLPDYPLPEGFGLRMYRPGDEANWLAIERAADLYSDHPDTAFAQQFGTDAEVLARRQFYLCDAAGWAVGTTTAWFDDDFDGRPYGRVHWVAIVPEYQGRGLAKVMLSAACRRLRELGHVRAVLGTQTKRVVAIRLYLCFGFRPYVRNEAELAAWRTLRDQLPDDLPGETAFAYSPAFSR